MLSDQPIAGFRDGVILCHDDVIPECYAEDKQGILGETRLEMMPFRS